MRAIACAGPRHEAGGALAPGAACHAEAPEAPSGVMQAIGATAQQAYGALRLSLGYGTRPDDIKTAGGHIIAAHRPQLVACRHAGAQRGNGVQGLTPVEQAVSPGHDFLEPEATSGECAWLRPSVRVR